MILSKVFVNLDANQPRENLAPRLAHSLPREPLAAPRKSTTPPPQTKGLTYPGVEPRGALFLVVDVVDLSFGGSSLLPALREGPQVGVDEPHGGRSGGAVGGDGGERAHRGGDDGAELRRRRRRGEDQLLLLCGGDCVLLLWRGLRGGCWGGLLLRLLHGGRAVLLRRRVGGGDRRERGLSLFARVLPRCALSEVAEREERHYNSTSKIRFNSDFQEFYLILNINSTQILKPRLKKKKKMIRNLSKMNLILKEKKKKP